MTIFNLEDIKILIILSGSAHEPAYIEFFDTVSKRTVLHSIKTFQKHFKLSDDELEQILKDNT